MRKDGNQVWLLQKNAHNGNRKLAHKQRLTSRNYLSTNHNVNQPKEADLYQYLACSNKCQAMAARSNV